jgi:alpha-ketoglutarate-dependent taurine dioxygenase
MSTTRELTVERLDATFGAVVRGLRLTELDDATFAEIHALWLELALLIFPDQPMSAEEQNAFARRFGDLEFDAAPLSNLRQDGTLRPDDGSDDMVKILRGNMDWHADSTYLPVQAKGAVFTAQVVPPAGGETGWADMRAAYDALDDATRRRIEPLMAHHSLYHSQPDVGDHDGAGAGYSGYGFFGQEPPLRPLVKTHPETGRRSLLIGRHAYGIGGLDADESERLLEELLDHACRPPRTYHHRWSVGDAVIWDNRCLLHRARPWDMTIPRVMFHARIAGDPASEYAGADGATTPPS